ncbi:MAG: ferritin-like domain-containing protein, partial [Anaerolineales bacterium]
AELQTLKALPKMIKAAHSGELRQAFRDHLEKTREHVQRLAQIFADLGELPTGDDKSKSVAALIKEAKNLIKEDGPSPVLDAALISAAQKIEHYEIAGYGAVRTYAQMLLHDEAADLLQRTLNEEGETDQTLTEIAEATLSVEAKPERLDDLHLPDETGPGVEDVSKHHGATEQPAPQLKQG